TEIILTNAFDDLLAEEVRGRGPRALDLLRTLIGIPSISGFEGKHDVPGSVGGILWEAIGAAGLIERYFEAVDPARENIIAVLHGTSRGRVLVMDAHTDTVPPGDHSDWIGGDPFSAREGRVTYLGTNRVRLEVDGRAL